MSISHCTYDCSACVFVLKRHHFLFGTTNEYDLEVTSKRIQFEPTILLFLFLSSVYFFYVLIFTFHSEHTVFIATYMVMESFSCTVLSCYPLGSKRVQTAFTSDSYF